MFRKIIPTIILALIFVGIQFKADAQLKVAHIDIEGNVKTKAYIILRELPYKVGTEFPEDSLSVLNTIAKQQLINTSLFYDAQVTAQQVDSSNINILIKVSERWYFFPLPYFRWVDRNFSEWWNTQHRSLDRVNYGINLKQGNATGNNDKLTVALITGYTQQSVVKYQFPYLDKKLKIGAGIGWQYFTQKELNSSSYADKQVFVKTQDVIQSGYRANINLFYRANLFERHSLQIGFGKNNISDSALLLQPHYLPNYQKSFSYVDINLAYAKVKFNYNAYPSQGNSTELSLFQRMSGNQNLTAIQFRKVHAHSFSPRNFYLLETNTIGKILPNLNYMDSKLMGYGNLQMNGFEYYVIDGNAGSIFKAELHHSLGSITVPKTMGIGIVDRINKHLPEIKYQFWLKAFTNLGYAYSERPVNSSKLSNTLLRSVGVGLDVISIYDLVIKIDYSVNQLGDKGVYLHGGINF